MIYFHLHILFFAFSCRNTEMLGGVFYPLLDVLSGKVLMSLVIL